MKVAQTLDLNVVIADWDAILARVESGATITITVAGKPVGQLVPPDDEDNGNRMKVG